MMGVAAREAAQAFCPEEVARLTLGIYEHVLGTCLPNDAQRDGLKSNKDD